ncbi:MAG: Crp/Fnr family transcriptional regulator [Clostridia bacterium]|nr:Crp/Fnr family transcriptional regulator [Clostridia bacterium]
MGAPDFFCGSTYGITATAYTNVQMVAFSEEQVKELLGKDQEFSISLAHSLSQELRAIGKQLTGETFLPAIARIGLALQNLKVQIGTLVGDGQKIVIPITQSELAFFVGCNRVTVTKALNKMTDENLIEKKAKKIIIKDVDKLNNWLKKTIQI